MSLKANLPAARQAIVEAGGTPSRPLYVFLQNIATTVDALSESSGDVTIPELPISENANVIGASGFSIYTQGTLKTGIVRVLLSGDTQTPENTQYYGSGPTGARGWFNVSDALATAGNVTLTVGADGVTTFDLSAGVLASLALADSSVQPGDNVSDLTNDAGYVDAAGASAAAPVQSVNGATGTVALTAADVGAATTAQGAKADSAVQSIAAGTGVSVDATDPQNPIVSATGGGSGDVVGPSSSTDGNVALFDGATGKLLKDSGGSFAALVRAAVLTGLSTATSAAIAATDTVLQAFGKLQAQITDNLLPKGYIDGLKLVWVSSTAVTVTSGAAYIEGAGKVLRATADIAKNSLSLPPSTWCHLYLYDNAGTPDIDISTTLAAPYNGTARSKTGDSSRRYIGSIKTSASGAIYNFLHQGNQILYREDIANGPIPFRILNLGTATSDTTISCAAVVPTTSFAAIVRMQNTSTTGGFRVKQSDGTYAAGGAATQTISPGGVGIFTVPINASQELVYFFSSTPSGGGGYIDISGYVFER